MTATRRDTLKLGAGALVGFGATVFLPWTAHAQKDGDRFETEEKVEIRVYPIAHASFVMTIPGMTIYSDPVGGAAVFEGRPAPDLILITHEHGDHFDAPTLSAIVGENTRLITNPSVFEKLPDELKSKAAAIGNGETTTVGDLSIAAIPAYNTTEDRLKYHPKGRDNGYVLSVDGRRV